MIQMETKKEANNNINDKYSDKDFYRDIKRAWIIAMTGIGIVLLICIAIGVLYIGYVALGG